jgi:glyceraldehyde-3-phosphate dehydrogenase/erythrose-4-phosphate dehydrogenase
MTALNSRFIAVEANMSEANVKRAGSSRAAGTSNEWGFSNRMLDTTVALMAAK